MRWLCPQCGAAVNLALEECPHCARRAAAPPAEPPVRPAASTVAKKPAAPPGPAKAAPAAPAPPEESAVWRGVRFGVGFMLVVVTILLLLSFLLQWLEANPDWQRWLGH